VAVAAVARFAGEPGPDRFLAPVIESARALIAGRALRSPIEAQTGPLA
jgi:histidine ammonia-lyase